MRALAAAGSFHGAGDITFCADMANGGDILLPGTIIKNDGEKKAGIIGQNGVKANHIPTICICAAEMVVDHLIAQWNQLPMVAPGTSSLELDADTGFPFVGAHRRITGLFCLGAVPPPGKYILPATEQTAEQVDLFSRSAVMMDCRGGNWFEGFRVAHAKLAAKLSIFCFQFGNAVFQFFASLLPVHNDRPFREFSSFIIGTYGEESRDVMGNYDYLCVWKSKSPNR